ncbi:MAG: FKBP-type peptidyl-prolyl cis-trans isomerase [Spirochaetaceae bacterium]|jgi:FKBP-type peptidyl-prolyl cis-trans isomerase|nr:FKBP-type peptidyl-prolyl cis-trans isomerase [Spirochaetaceae bacterium]
MKKRFFLFFTAYFLTLECFAAGPLTTFDNDASYAFGVIIAGQISDLEVTFDKRQFSEGFFAQMEDTGGKSRLSFEEAVAKVTGVLSGEGPHSFDAETSYAMGFAVAYQLVSGGIKVKYNKAQFLKGLEAELAGASEIPIKDAEEKIEGILEMATETQAKENLAKSEKFLADNAKKHNVKTTQSGLQYAVIKNSAGTKPDAESLVTVNYEGRLIDGTVFDSSYERGEPAQFPLGDVIAGWTEGIQLMSLGSKFTFYIPPNLGYGDMAGIPIPPNSVLIFDVELLAVE